MRVLIEIPTFENIAPDTFKSIYGLQKPPGVSCLFNFTRGYDCARARNLIAKEAMDYDYVLMVDSDIILPNFTLVSMLSRNVDVCLGAYLRKNSQTQIEIFKLGQKDFVETYTKEELDAMHGGIAKVKGGGFGCALIKSDVFRKLRYPFFDYVEYPTGEVLSEDNYFCRQCNEAGIPVYVDSLVRCGHINRVITRS